MKHIALTLEGTAANCPFCGAYSNFKWSPLQYENNGTRHSSFVTGWCTHCGEMTVWKIKYLGNGRGAERISQMIYPISGGVASPNNDLPDEIKKDYIEAAAIVELSPRGAVALLRLGVQKLCKHLGEKGENINSDIKSLVSKGLNATIQRALDSVRVTGNSAVHPGVLDISDDRETAYKMFGFINIIADVMITQPKMINEYYELNIPEGDKNAIAKRDGK